MVAIEPPSSAEAAPPDGSSQPRAAAAAPAEAASAARKDRSVYVAISPLHLLLPVLEVTTEVRLHERIGVAGIAGIGSINPQQFEESKPPPGVTMSRFTVWELGAQAIAYPVGHFDHGMQLGAEILYLGIAGDASNGRVKAFGSGQGLAVGPFVGYKFTAPVGFSLNVQAGVQYAAVQAAAETSTSSASERTSSVIPLFNLNVGWAF